MRRAVFLDRDGVLVAPVVRDGRAYSVSSVAELVVLDGAVEACERLRAAGFVLVVVTNQPEVARGTLAAAELEAMHRRLDAEVPVDAILCCMHDDRDGCSCRKPAPGMLVDAAARFGLDLARSYMVGDRWRDVAAGRSAGCTTVFVDASYDEPRPDDPDVVVADLAEACRWILADTDHAPAPDDWDQHWADYADAARTNPAQQYRRRLVLGVLGAGSGSRILDIGSGQGDLAADLATAYPTAEVAGIELSRIGVERAAAKVPSASFTQVDLLAAAKRRPRPSAPGPRTRRARRCSSTSMTLSRCSGRRRRTSAPVRPWS